MSFGIYTIQFYVQSSLPLLRRFLQGSLRYIPISKRMCNIHLHIFFDDLVKCGLRHPANILQRRLQIHQRRKTEVSFRKIHCPYSSRASSAEFVIPSLFCNAIVIILS